MCELFGASAESSRRFDGWLRPFRGRGGETADNPDGWGIAWWHEGEERIEKSPEPGHGSERFAALAEAVDSQLVLAHVRKASYPPSPAVLNTHPFVHECCGRRWVFAHNGMVPDIVGRPCALASCRPDGDTDSEFAFCHLLAGIVDAYDPADVGHWLNQLVGRADEIARLGEFNFLLSDGNTLIAHGHDHLHHAEPETGVVIIATAPLDEGDWQPFAPGELRVYRQGQLLACHKCGSETTCRR